MKRQPAQPARRWRLRGETEGRPLILLLGSHDNVVGSIPDADLRVPHPTVSRRHARICVLDSKLIIEDLGSKNGTLVNGERVGRIEMRAGDHIQFGAMKFVLESVDVEDIALAIPLEWPRSSAPQPVEQPSTGSDQGSDRRARWLDLVVRLGDLVLEPTEPDLQQVLHELQQSLGARSIALVERSEDGGQRVLQVIGDTASLSALEGAANAFSLVHEIGAKQRTRRTFEIPGKQTLVLAISAAPGRPTLGLAVVGGSEPASWTTALGEFALQLFTHSHSEQRSSRRVTLTRKAPGLVFPDGYVVGSSDVMRDLYWQMRQFLQSDLPTLITGETGVGKEHIARILHASSPRRQGPFQAINCAAVPAGLFEAELFGVQRGAATGVIERLGQFQLACGGVLFLDEIGEMPFDMQAKLLRVLQLMEVHAVGARHPTRVDVRVLAATNVSPEDILMSGKLRKDLYYRIAGCTFHVPPLREHREDIPVLVEHFMRVHAGETNRGIAGITVRALRLLVQAQWPGNVRELENEVRRLVYLCPEGLPIDTGMLPLRFIAPESGLTATGGPSTSSNLGLQSRTDDLQRALITAALARAKWNRSKAAKLLGVSRDGLRLKMDRLGIKA